MNSEHHRQLLSTFYDAFQRLDGAAMSECYSADAKFSDPAFPDLRGPAIGAMWRMLAARAKDFELEYEILQVHERGGTVQWRARYTFSRGGRRVDNRILATIGIVDGKFVEHQDSFDFWRWSRMALGPVGWVLGWTPFLQRKVQQQAGSELQRWIEREASSAGEI